MNISADSDAGVILPRVLLIEDDESIREILVELLSEFFHIKACRDAISGAVTAYEFLPDVILLDLEMQGFGGWDVVNVLTRDSRTTEIPIVILTSLDSDDHRRRAEDAGYPYLKKPIQSDLVIDLLLGVVEKSA